MIIIIVYFTPNSKISYTEVQVSNENGVKIAHMQKVAVYKVAPLGRIGETKLKNEVNLSSIYEYTGFPKKNACLFSWSEKFSDW